MDKKRRIGNIKESEQGTDRRKRSGKGGSLIFRVLAHPLLREFSFHFARPPTTLVISFRVTFVLRSSLPLPRSFPFDSQDTSVLRNGVSRTDFVAIDFRMDERSATIAIPSNPCPSSNGERNSRTRHGIGAYTLDESFYAGSASIRRRIVATLRTLRASCPITRKREDDFEQNATARKLDFPETSASFDRACENNRVVIEKERRYRRRYR